MGISGIPAPVDVGFDDILDILDFAWASTLDIRCAGGDWGFILDFTYLKASPGSDQPLPGPSSLRGIGIEQILVDAHLRGADAEGTFFPRC